MKTTYCSKIIDDIRYTISIDSFNTLNIFTKHTLFCFQQDYKLTISRYRSSYQKTITFESIDELKEYLYTKIGKGYVDKILDFYTSFIMANKF